MNSEESREREERAFEALVASQLSSHCDNEKIDPDDLPELSPEEVAEMNSLGGDFATRLIASYDNGESERCIQSKLERKRSNSGRRLVHGMNRADEIGADAAEELERRREEALRELKQRVDEEDHGSD